MAQQSTLALKHWGLDRWPFCSLPGVGQFYPTAGHDEALARIEYLVESRRRLAVLVGESGVGKSLVLREAAKRLARKGRAVAIVHTLGATTREVFRQIASGLGTTPREDADAPWLWRQVADRIAENRARQVASVLLVDDAGLAGPDLVMQFARLARLETTPASQFTMVLAAEPVQVVRWNETLRNLVDLRIDVPIWTAEDTIGYVQTALVEAGRFEPVFEDAALSMLHELADGVPRQVIRLADFVLLVGAAAGAETIDEAMVQGANEEIAWPSVAAAY